MYVEIKNTSDQASFRISKDVKQAIEGKGYRVIDNPDKAHYRLQASTCVQQNNHTTTHWQHDRARIVSTADKVNLTITSALAPLEHGITSALAGLF